MMITHEILQNALDVFVAHFNRHDFTKACQLYSPKAVLVDEFDTCVGRGDIIDFYEDLDFSQIVNHHLTSTIADDGKRALVMTEFTMACNEAEYVEFHQGCGSLLFLLDEQDNLYVIAGVSIILKKGQ
jgi:hypothetical protein